MEFKNATCKNSIRVLALAAIGCSLLQPVQILAHDEPMMEMSSDEQYMTSDAGQISDDGDGLRFEFSQLSKEKENIEAGSQAQIFTIGKDQSDDDVVREYMVKEDPRTIVADTTASPYSAICKLTMMFEDENGEAYQFVGSGYVIGPSTILTCAHCVYDTENDLGWLKQIRIEPGRNGSDLPFGSYNTADVKYIEIEDDWAKAGGQDNDNALIVLNKNIGDVTGILPLTTDTSDLDSIHLAGYPAKYKNTRNMGTPVEDDGAEISINGRCIESDVYGSGGQSGSPFLNEQGEVVGTFAYDYVFKNRTGGPVMDETRIAWIQKYSDIRLENGHPNTEDAIQDAAKNEAPVYRLYNPNSGEHFYTMDKDEQSTLTGLGWKAEGIAWKSSSAAEARPVYRLYNPNTGDHHYTIDENEYTTLDQLCWKQEGMSWMAKAEGSQDDAPVYRLYNPNAAIGSHHFTESNQEKNALVEHGWKSEDIAFYVSK